MRITVSIPLDRARDVVGQGAVVVLSHKPAEVARSVLHRYAGVWVVAVDWYPEMPERPNIFHAQNVAELPPLSEGIVVVDETTFPYLRQTVETMLARCAPSPVVVVGPPRLLARGLEGVPVAYAVLASPDIPLPDVGWTVVSALLLEPRPLLARLANWLRGG